MNGSHGDRYDLGGKHRGARKPFPGQVPLRNLLDRICGEPRNYDDTPLDRRRCCETRFSEGHAGTCELSVMVTGIFIPGDQWPDPCPGCGALVASSGQWCQDCIDAADAEPLGQFTGGTE